MPIRMVPDKGYEVVKIRYVILRGRYLGTSDKANINSFLSIVKKQSKYPIEAIFTNNRTAEKFQQGQITSKSGAITSGVTILVHCLMKNPTVWKRVYEPLVYSNIETIPFKDATLTDVLNRMVQGSRPTVRFVNESILYSNNFITGLISVNNVPIFP